jgi:hypothetical protein
VAASIGHLALIIGVQSALGEQLAREEAKIRKFAGQASKDMQGIKGPSMGGDGGGGAAKGSIAGGVLGFMAGGPMGQLMGGASPMGMAIGIGIQKIREQFMAGARDADLFAQHIREVEKSLTSIDDKAEAIRLGIITPGESDRMKEADNEIKKLEGSYEEFKSVRAEIVGVFAAGSNMIIDGFKRDVMGIESLNAAQYQAREDERKRFEERIKATKALRDSMNDEQAAIGKTAREAEILKMAKQGLSNADRDSLLTQAKLIDSMKKQSEAAQKLKDDTQSYYKELADGISAIGKTADQVKLDGLFGAGMDKGMGQFLENMARVKTEMQAGFALVERNPLDILAEQMAGIDELARRGTITAQQAADATAKAKKGFTDKGASALAAGPAFLERGSAAEASYLKQLEVEQAQRELMEGQLAQQRQQAGLQADANKLLGDVVNAVQKQVVIKVLGV